MSRSSVVNVDDYESSVAGIEIHSTRVAPGPGENSVLAVRGDRLVSTSCRIGFPILSRTTIPDDQLVLACITETGAGSRWCGIDLEPGTVLLYAPAVEHAATNRPGLAFTFVTATLDQTHATAEGLGLRLALPKRGQVTALEPATDATEVRRTFVALRDAASGGTPLERIADESLRMLAKTLGAEPPSTRVGNARPVNRRRAVNQCIAYAEAMQRTPSIAELCRVAHLSERSLRRAFQSEFDLPPAQFFRVWALGEANRRLQGADAERARETVTDVALDLGFTHLSRFAGSYRRLFGESPSATLRS